MTSFKPMLSAKLTREELPRLKYPLLGSPKVDGIRCVITADGPKTRSLKPIRNDYVRQYLSHPKFIGLDGELIVGEITASDVFNKTTSGVMSKDGTPDFSYYVFDRFLEYSSPYHARVRDMTLLMEELVDLQAFGTPPRVFMLPHMDIGPEDWINNEAEMLFREETYLLDGYEGIMLRRPDGIYKFGRSTLIEGHLIKFKRMEDAEATIVGFEELYRNENEAVRDLLGHQRRSAHQAGKVAAATLGNLLVEHHTFGRFAIGSGFDSALRLAIWQDQARYLGKEVKFSYQQVGIVDKPRFPIFQGFRED